MRETNSPFHSLPKPPAGDPTASRSRAPQSYARPRFGYTTRPLLLILFQSAPFSKLGARIITDSTCAHMDLYTEAQLPVDLAHFREAFHEFLRFVHERSLPATHTSILFALHEAGCKANRFLAQSVPPHAKNHARIFVLGPHLDMRKLITAEQFLAEWQPAHLRSYCHATLTHFLSFDKTLALVEQVADIVAPSRRGISFMLNIDRVGLRGAPDTLRADFSFARWRAGANRKSAVIRVSHPAESKSDRAAKQTLRAAVEKLGLRFGKTWTQHPTGTDQEQPDPNALWVAQKSFQAAFDLAATTVQKEEITLDSVPLLLPRFEAAGKRIADVQQGKREQVDLLAHLKRHMRETLAIWEFDQADGEVILFRKNLAPSLDAKLIFERFHHHGLGKSFTLNFGVEFPGNPKFQQNPVLQIFRESFFTLFHRSGEQPAWTYATSDELHQALRGCTALLSRCLPLLEQNLVAFLSPVPVELPKSIPSRGALSAKEAYAHALPLAQSCAEDVVLESISSGANMFHAHWPEEGPGINDQGRLQPHGDWSVRFLSRHRGAHIFLSVPHTGALRWSTFSFPFGTARYSTMHSDDWLDSPAIAAIVREILCQRVADDQLRLGECLYRLRAMRPDANKFVWEVHAILLGPDRQDEDARIRHDVPVRADLRLLLDPHTGTILETHATP